MSSWRALVAAPTLLLLLASGAGAAIALETTTPTWEPTSGSGVWELVDSSTDDSTANAAGCGASSIKLWQLEQRQVRLQLVPCDDDRAAQVLAEVMMDSTPPSEPFSAAVLGDGVERVFWNLDALVALRVWVQGGLLVLLSDTSVDGGREESLALNAEHAESLAATLDGTPVAATAYGPDALGTLLVVPLLIWLLVVAPLRGIIGLFRTRYPSTPIVGDGRYHDVTGTVRAARWRRRLRMLLRVLSVIGPIAGALAVANVALGGGPQWVVAAIVWASITAGSVIARRRVPAHRVEKVTRLPGSGGARGLVGRALSVVAYVGLVAVCLGYVLVYLLAQPIQYQQPAEGVLSGPADWVLRLAYDSPELVVLAIVIPSIVVLFLVDLLGRRLRAASLREALQRDTRAPFIYLRSFDEDTLQLAASLRRKGLIGRLSVVRRQRFEEVLVSTLSVAGPVIAVSPPGTRLPPIGAARASFGNDEWQSEVQRYSEIARAVVLSATPASIREGFGWEIDLVANRIGHSRVLVVVGPWRAAELRKRWRAFRDFVAPLPLFAPLAVDWIPDGVQVLAHSVRQGWQAWGATTRTDWSYSVSIDEALERYHGDWSET